MLDEGVWAEVRLGNEHLRLFSERNASGVMTSVYNVKNKNWIALPNSSMTVSKVNRERRLTQKRT